MVAASLALERPAREAQVYEDWLSGYHYQEVFGRYTYLGVGVRGFGTSTAGAPSDGYGRLVYIDTHNSVYGADWRRETSIVSHGTTGVFCHGFVPAEPVPGHYAHPSGAPHRKRGPGQAISTGSPSQGRASLPT